MNKPMEQVIMRAVGDARRHPAPEPRRCSESPPKCDGSGHWIIRDDEGLVVGARRCPCAEKDPRIENLKSFDAELPSRFRPLTDAHRPEYRDIIKRGSDLQRMSPPRGLLIRGRCGLDKARIAIALVRQHINETGKSASYCTGLEMQTAAHDFRKGDDGWEVSEEYFNRLRTVGVLLVDEFEGAGGVIESRRFSDLVESRYNDCRLTYVTSSLTKQQMDHLTPPAALRRMRSEDWMIDEALK